MWDVTLWRLLLIGVASPQGLLYGSDSLKHLAADVPAAVVAVAVAAGSIAAAAAAAVSDWPTYLLLLLLVLLLPLPFSWSPVKYMWAHFELRCCWKAFHSVLPTVVVVHGWVLPLLHIDMKSQKGSCSGSCSLPNANKTKDKQTR